MKRAGLILLIAGGGLTTMMAQVAQNPGRGAPVQSPGVGTAGVTSTALNPMPPGGVYAINLGTGELIGPSPATTGVVVQPTAPRPPTHLAVVSRSSITPVQMQNINRMDVELNALGLPGRDPVEQQRALTQSLMVAPVGTLRPAPETVARLGSTLARVVPSFTLTAAQRRQLAIDVNLALNSGTLSRAEVQRVLADARSLLQPRALSNGAAVEQLMGELTAVTSELQSKGSEQTEVSSAPAAGATPPTQVGQGGTSQTGQGTGAGPGQPPP